MSSENPQEAPASEPELAPETPAAPAARIARRPILDAGIALVVLVVTSLIVLITTRSIGIFGPEPNADPTLDATTAYGIAPWPQIARVAIAFALPAIICVVVVVLRDMELSRGTRYAYFSLATIFLAYAITIAVMAATGDRDAPSTIANLHRMAMLANPAGLLITAGFGCCLGLSLPAVRKRSVFRRHHRVRRSRRRVTFYVLTGLVISIVLYMIAAIGPLSDDPAPWDAWFRDFVTLPAIAYQATTLTVAIAGRFLEVHLVHSGARGVMVALPLIAWAGIAVTSAVTGLEGLPAGFGWVLLMVVLFCGLGVLPGIVIAGMRD